jgi:hypothetical protein
MEVFPAGAARGGRCYKTVALLLGDECNSLDEAVRRQKLLHSGLTLLWLLFLFLLLLLLMLKS